MQSNLGARSACSDVAPLAAGRIITRHAARAHTGPVPTVLEQYHRRVDMDVKCYRYYKTGFHFHDNSAFSGKPLSFDRKDMDFVIVVQVAYEYALFVEYMSNMIMTHKLHIYLICHSANGYNMWDKVYRFYHHGF